MSTKDEAVATVTRTDAGWKQAKVFGVVVSSRYGESGGEPDYRDIDALVERINAAATAVRARDREALELIREYIETMLVSATTIGEEFIEGYQIKTGALHRMIGLLQAVGLPVTVPLPSPSPAQPEPRKPLTDEQIEDCIDEANREFNRYRSIGGARGQQATPLDDWKHWLARSVERAHGIGDK